MSHNTFNNNSDYIANLIETARKEVPDFWSDINTLQHKRLLKQLHDIQSQQKLK